MAYLATFAGIAAYEVGLRFSSVRSLGRWNGLTKLLAREISIFRLLTTSAVATITVPFLAFEFIGLDLLFAPRSERFDALVEATAGANQARLQFVIVLISVVPMVCTLVLTQLLIRSKQVSDGTAWRYVFALAPIGLICAVVNNPISTPRYLVGTIVLGLLFAYLLEKERKGRWLSVILALAFVFVFPLADIFRVSFDPTDSIYHSDKLVTILIEKPDYDAFQQLMNAVTYVEEKGVSAGKQLLGTLGFWVPRNFWLDKPVSSGELLAEYRGYINTNLSLPLWGELYLDGSIAFVVVGMGLYGWATAQFENYSKNRMRTDTRITLGDVLPIFYAAYQIFLLRGSLLPAFAYFVPIVVLLLIWSTRSRPSTFVAPANSR
jgi:hypothetical protein